MSMHFPPLPTRFLQLVQPDWAEPFRVKQAHRPSFTSVTVTKQLTSCSLTFLDQLPGAVQCYSHASLHVYEPENLLLSDTAISKKGQRACSRDGKSKKRGLLPQETPSTLWITLSTSIPARGLLVEGEQGSLLHSSVELHQDNSSHKIQLFKTKYNSMLFLNSSMNSLKRCLASFSYLKASTSPITFRFSFLTSTNSFQTCVFQAHSLCILIPANNYSHSTARVMLSFTLNNTSSLTRKLIHSSPQVPSFKKLSLN